jgi:hypothetical protein
MFGFAATLLCNPTELDHHSSKTADNSKFTDFVIAIDVGIFNETPLPEARISHLGARRSRRGLDSHGISPLKGVRGPKERNTGCISD